MTQSKDGFSEIVRIRDTVAAEAVDGGMVLLDLEENQYFGLYGAGARAWECLLKNGRPEDAVALLLEEFEVDEGTLRADMRSFVESLLEAGLFSKADGSSESNETVRPEVCE